MKQPFKPLIIALLLAIFRLPTLSAEVTLSPVFGNHMVLQCGRPIPVWGTATPGEAVSVTLGNQTKQTTTDSRGNWRLNMEPRVATAVPVNLVVSASNKITIQDILTGEVWICSGQSNMHWPVRLSASGAKDLSTPQPQQIRLLNLQGAAYPSGHLFTPQEQATCVPPKYMQGAWATCTPQSAAEFSAIAYHFGLELHAELGVPVGLIHNALGGTPTEAWVNRQTLATNALTRGLLADNWLENPLVASFCRTRALTNLPGLKTSQAIRHPYQPGFMFEAAITPLAPFPIRGAIWYQGESNTHNPTLHDNLFTAMVLDWRKAWQQGDFPVLYVQLPNKNGADDWPAFRASQFRCQKIPNTHMAVTIDSGDPNDIHPTEKRPVAHRLALLARSAVYGEKIASSGPVAKAASIEGNLIKLSFSQTSGGLSCTTKTVDGFEVAGEDGLFQAAKATILGESIEIAIPNKTNPKSIRWAHEANPTCHLMNASGLPASPFSLLLPSSFGRR